MKMFRCYNCENAKGMPGLDFPADAPVCPNCGLDGRDPKFAGLFAPLVCIHFDAPHAVAKNRGVGHAACDPKLPIGTVRGSGHPDAVSCPACRETEAFQAAQKAVSVNPEDNFPLTVDLQGGEYRKA